MTSANFFLSTAGEYQPLSQPRACKAIARLCDPVRDDYMLVKVEPCLVGQLFGLAGHNICHLIISTRYQGSSLFPILEWPAHVYVTRILDEVILQTLSFSAEQVELVAWGSLFRTLDEAEAFYNCFKK